jgi:hypothetical protein
VFDGAERPRIEMRAARGWPVFYCRVLLLPTARDDEIENGQPGNLPL